MIERITEIIGDKVELQLGSNNSFHDLSYKRERRRICSSLKQWDGFFELKQQLSSSRANRTVAEAIEQLMRWEMGAEISDSSLF